MAGRVTKEAEDIAYSMLGFFGITITPQYGEGRIAFMRLQRTLMETSIEESIFAWTVPKNCLLCFRRLDRTSEFSPKNWGLLTPSRDCFEGSGDVIVIQKKIVARLGDGYRWTQQGVQFPMPNKPGTEAFHTLGYKRSNIILPLNCWEYDIQGKLINVVLELARTGNECKRER